MFDFLRNDGSIEMNVDGSVTPVKFMNQVPDNKEVSLRHVNVLLMDAEVDMGTFGALAVLTKGVTVFLSDENHVVLKDLCAGAPIIRNADWALLAGTDVQTRVGAGSDDALIIRWDFDEACGSPVYMKSGHHIEININDDLSGISIFRALVQGLLITVGG